LPVAAKEERRIQGDHIFADLDIPIFLLDIYGKGSQANLSPAERNELRSIPDRSSEGLEATIKNRASKTRSGL